jgi:predicted Ser/Thr protein kinase
VWHSVNINVLDLKRVEQLTGATFEAMLSKPTTSTTTIHPPSLPTNIIAKTARFEWEIPRIEQETRAYQLLQQQDPELAPQFLGHIHEEGRVMGFLLEKLDGRRHASISDLSDCEAALKRLHSLGLSHGDVNRYNFLVGENDVKLIDFERFQERVTEELYSKELESLRMELTDESGRGAGFIFCDEEVQGNTPRNTLMLRTMSGLYLPSNRET